MTPVTYCVLDYETRSKANLKLVGGYEYARHASTGLLCAAWKIGTLEQLPTAKTELWSPYLPETDLDSLEWAFAVPHVRLVAHNAFFEQVITRFVMPKHIDHYEIKSLPISRWMCTASLARSVALPGKLEGAAAALKLPFQKDMEGHRLMLKLSKPRKATKHNPAVWHQKVSDLKRVMEYCATDVDAETALLLTLPPLQETERRVWELDQKINWRGFRVDRPLVKKTLGWISEESKRHVSEINRLTDGEIDSANKLNKVLKWLTANGASLPNLQKKTVEDALAAGLATGPAKAMLELRQESAKASTKKYLAYLLRSATDSRIRDSLVFHTASTGRFGGAGLQPHNFPRPNLANIPGIVRILEDDTTDLETIRMLWGSPLNVFANTLRPMIQATEGKELFGGDFAGIEVRILFWLAHHEAGLRAYREGRDLYCEIASIIYGRLITKLDTVQRQLGKESILGFGFGLGTKGFFINCKQKGMAVTEQLAERAKKAYRTEHAPVVKLWYNLERAAMAAVKNPGKRYSINRTKWWVKDGYLWCELPSGKRLAYYGAQVRDAKKPWGEVSPSLWHWDVHPKTKKWVFVPTHGGRLAENVTQGTAADLMKAAMLRVDEMNYDILITIHDEIISEYERGKRTLKHYVDAMCVAPPWADGLPIKVEGFNGPRYVKG